MSRFSPPNRCFLTLVTGGLIACQSRSPQSAGSGQTTAAQTTVAGSDTSKSMSGMAGMQETNGATTSAALMDSVREEMARSRGMKAEELKAAIPMHRQMTANMLAQMNADMRSMNMTGDPAWTALVDSLRRDLVRLADIPAADVAAVFPGHEARVNRLIAMHQQMMKR